MTDKEVKMKCPRCYHEDWERYFEANDVPFECPVCGHVFS